MIGVFMITFTAKKNDKLVKCVLENVKGVSFSAVMKLLRNKDVKVNGTRVNKDLKINAGDKVEIYYSPKIEEPISVIYSDENVLIVDKKSGYTSEEIFEFLSKKEQVYFIHRLDRNTSGVMVFAKNETAEKELISGFKNRSFIKIYAASVFKKMEKKEDVLTAYLIKDAEKSTVKIYDKKVNGATEIKTGYKVISYDNKSNISRLQVRLYTGKTHQIRAHLAFIGHPIVGDGKYGDNKMNKAVKVKSQILNAYSITFNFDKENVLYYLDGKTFYSGEN